MKIISARKFTLQHYMHYFDAYIGFFSIFLRAQSYTTTLQVILTCSYQNHLHAQIYTTTLQALFSRIYWILFDISSRAKLHYNTTGDFNMLISKPSGCTGLHYSTTGNIFAHILDFFRCSFARKVTLQHYR